MITLLLMLLTTPSGVPTCPGGKLGFTYPENNVQAIVFFCDEDVIFTDSFESVRTLGDPIDPDGGPACFPNCRP